MNIPRPARACTALAFLLALATALPAPARAQAEPIAVMDIDGRAAFLDDRQQPRSAQDISVHDGNLVRTGKNTSVMIDIIREGHIQLNENSAKLVTRSFFKGAKCFAVRLIAGELFINGDNVCFVTNVGSVSGISHSLINIRVDAGSTEITVIEGTAELEGQADPVVAHASEQIVVHADGRYEIRRLTQEAALHTAEWTTHYFNADSSSSSGGNAVGGIVAAILAALIVREALDDDDDDDDRRRDPPPPPPASQPPSDDVGRGRHGTAPPTAPPAGTTGTRDADASRVLRRPDMEAQPQNCCIPRGDYGEDSYQMTPAACHARGGRLADRCTRPVR